MSIETTVLDFKLSNTFEEYEAMQTGVTAVRILQAIDVKVRHAESFGAIQDITT